MRRPIPASEKTHAIALLASGRSVRSVSDETGISRSLLSTLAHREGIDVTSNRGGRPRRLSSSEVKLLARAVSTDKVRNCREGAHFMEQSLAPKVSAQTIRRSLRGLGFRAVVKKRKPALKIAHRQARLRFAKRYAEFTLEDWKRVIWSDETKINRFGSDGRRWVWRSPGAAKDIIHDREVQPTYKFGGGGIMLWGCMSSKGVGGFCRIHGTMDAELYTEILRGELLDTIKDHKLKKEKVIFQQDNDPKHTSKKAQECIKELGLNLLDWPAQSPDLNPIEHLWKHLKRKLEEYSEPADGVEELWERVDAEWLKIPPEVVMGLIESMPRRIQAVIRARGGHTKY
jgi:hypothetical protein